LEIIGTIILRFFALDPALRIALSCSKKREGRERQNLIALQPRKGFFSFAET